MTTNENERDTIDMDNNTNEHDKAADKAREYLLSSQVVQEKAGMVGEIAAAVAEQTALQDALTANEKRIDAAYAAALKGGWTTEDLTALGYRPPKTTRTTRRGGRRGARRNPGESTTEITAATPPALEDNHNTNNGYAPDPLPAT